MINMHPRLRVPRESWFLIPLLDGLPLNGSLTEQEKEQAFQMISGHSRWNDWECGADKLQQAIFHPDVTDLASLVEKVFIDCAGMQGKPRWGDKTPKYSYYVKKLRQVFPEAKFIHLFRDARDTCLSMRNGGWCEGDIQRIARQWVGMTLAAREGMEFGPDHYLELSYEALVSEPEKHLRIICDFLGETYHPEMLEFHLTAAKETAPWEDQIHLKTRSPLGKTNVGTWRQGLSRRELWVVESYAGPTMRSLGQTAVLGPKTATLRWGFRTFLEARLRILHLAGKIRNRLGRTRKAGSESDGHPA